ncbi:iron chelate uptake ABC transporter family permease subunit [Paenibacillus sp. JX-17]|uniref:Iron chelate uptake ABC transporter family permease subunit n=1 Tax=Paenibacillus lacisoli TaxID=3064525 RepID=A0ABT9CG79_9BACL|nr:iron chelate uptake ABC transporter family permease subunit [Paenibacillus sp. JX-17]MDO7907900.1 iron chelate uptake ABC transporter family permease subunit [Paenibacillus sp. JX-17]
MSYRTKISLLAVIAVLLMITFLFLDLPGNWQYALPRRTKKVLAIALTGAAIAFATVLFQTITNNRILTPSIIGLDSLYMLVQTFVVFVFGSVHIVMLNKQLNFIISVGFMVLFAGVLYRIIFRREGRNIYFLLLIGLVCGTLFSSLSTFMEVLIDPNEFAVIQDKSFASFNNVNTELLVISFAGVSAVALYYLRYAKYMDVLSLGKEHAVNLGVPYDTVVKKLLIAVSILISISTALVGPITFLGLLVANVTYEFMKTYRHRYLITASILISMIALVGSQLLAERVFELTTTISVIINFIGGVYFLYLLLRENRSW